MSTVSLMGGNFNTMGGNFNILPRVGKRVAIDVAAKRGHSWAEIFIMILHFRGANVLHFRCIILFRSQLAADSREFEIFGTDLPMADIPTPYFLPKLKDVVAN